MRKGKKKLKIVILSSVILLFVGLYACPGAFQGAERGTVEHTVKTAIRIQYGWGSMNALKKLCTFDMANRSDFRCQRVGWGLYSINEDEGYILEDPANSQKMTVSVAVYSPDLRFHVFSLVKDDKGVYKITDIEYDI